MAEYFGMFAVSGLAVTLFLGGWHAPIGLLEFVPSYIWFFAKLGALIFVFIWVRGTLPRTRVDQMMNFAWKFMALVTALTAISAVLFSWNVEERRNEFFFWLLLVIGGSYGVFLSADLFLFFVFYELVIVPKYFLIAIWGSTNKEYGAMKLTLYSFFGGVLVFLGIITAYVTAGSLDFNELSRFAFDPALQKWAFPVLFVGFAVLAGMINQ